MWHLWSAQKEIRRFEDGGPDGGEEVVRRICGKDSYFFEFELDFMEKASFPNIGERVLSVLMFLNAPPRGGAVDGYGFSRPR